MIGLVTGANRGFGYEVVKEGLKRGHTMIASSFEMEPDQIKDLMELKAVHKEKLAVVALDVTDEKSVSNAYDEVSRLFDRVDFIVNSAGIIFERNVMPGDPIADINIDNFRKTLDVNVIGDAIVLKYFINLIYRSEDACIINVSSEAALLGQEGYGYMMYSTSKYALNMYSQKVYNYLRIEKPEKAIRLFMTHPGRMDTVMGKENAQIHPSESAKGHLDIIERKIDIPSMKVPYIDYKGNPM
jgi:Dehydrogenases with different specificities (related to short-chain alcohol dehydrogenases)